MADITFLDNRYALAADETVLECLTRHGALLPSKCKVGTCRKCMVRATSGRVAPEAQKGLRDTMAIQGYFLACQCQPTADLSLAPIDIADHRLTLVLSEQTQLAPKVTRLRFTSDETFYYRPGQSVNLIRPADQKVRSYCLASLPDEGFLEIHIRRTDTGDMGPWLVDQLNLGDHIEAYGPVGDCFFLPSNLSQPLLMVAISSGLGAIYGMLKDALRHGQNGPIHLIHAGHNAPCNYLSESLGQLAVQHPNLTYTPCVAEGPASAGGTQGNIDEVVKETVGDLSGYRIYLAGSPEPVKSLRRSTFLNGAAMNAIYAVSFSP